jgi:hypothetical protein
MEGLGLLSTVTEQLSKAAQLYRGNDSNVVDLSNLIRNTARVAEEAALRDSHAAAPVVQSLIQHVRQTTEMMSAYSGMGRLQKVVKMASLQEDLDAVITGVRDCLAAFSAANFCLSQQTQRSLQMIDSSLDAVRVQNVHANREILQALASHSERSNELMLEVVHAMMSRLQVNPHQLAEEARSAMGSSSGAGDSDGDGDSERQVGLDPPPLD